MRVLLIEDDKRLSRIIKEVFSEENINLDVANDGNLGLELALRGVYDVAIIDWMLPGRDGPSIARTIRSRKIAVRILMLTARSMVEDRVAGLQSGADDYLVKPFAFEELIARIYALARRDEQSGDPQELRVGELVMDSATQRIRRGTQSIELTKTEMDLLEYLMRHPGQAVTRQQILDYVWSYDRQVQQTMVDVYISYLRQKLQLDGMNDPIETVRGVGYRLDPENA